MDKPKVSILMITYNHGEFLEEALESILSQEFNYSYEIIIGEDNSPDNSIEILERFKQKYPEIIKIIHREKNIGAINNFYDVFIRANGDYIVYLEGDDYWTDKLKLKKQVEFLDENREYFGCYHIVDDIEDGELLRTYPSNENLQLGTMDVLDNPGQFLNIIKESNFIGTIHINSIMFRNEVDFKDDKIHDFICDAKMIADLQFEIILLTYGKLKLIRESMSVHRRITKENWTSFSSQKLKFIYEDYSHVLDNVNSFLDYKHDKETSLVIDKYNRSTIINCIKNNDYILAKQIINKLNFKSKIIIRLQIIKYLISQSNKK